MKESRRDILILAVAMAAALGGVAGVAAGQQAASAPASAPAESQGSVSASVERGIVPAPATGGDETRRVGERRGGSLGDYAQTLAALAFVVVLIFAARLLMKRVGAAAGGRRGTALDVIARTTIAPKQQLLLVRLGKRLVLLGCTPAGFATLSEISDPQEAAAIIEAAQQGTFAQTLKGKMADSQREDRP